MLAVAQGQRKEPRLPRKSASGRHDAPDCRSGVCPPSVPAASANHPAARVPSSGVHALKEAGPGTLVGSDARGRTIFQKAVGPIAKFSRPSLREAVGRGTVTRGRSRRTSPLVDR